MAFFEQIGKKLADTGAGVAQQTKNFADVTRLNNSISEAEKKISQLYAAIGQAYYERHKNEPGSEEPDRIAEISALYSEINRYREEINRIKGTKMCPKCGAEVAMNSSFCNVCGSPVPEESGMGNQVQEDSRRCPLCNASVPEGTRFCTSCGARLDDAVK